MVSIITRKGLLVVDSQDLAGDAGDMINDDLYTIGDMNEALTTNVTTLSGNIDDANADIATVSGNVDSTSGEFANYGPLASANTWTASQTIPTVQLDATGAAPAHSEGLIFYDNGEKTLAVYNDESDVTLQLGQEIYLRATNKTGAEITNGQLVNIDGAQGNRPTVALAKSDLPATCGVVAMATHAVANNGTGFFTVFGLVRDLVLDPGTYTEGETLYLSDTTAGAWTNVLPSSPSFPIQVGTVVTAHVTQGAVLVNVGPTDVCSNMVIQDLDINAGLTTHGRIDYDQTFWDDLRFPASSTNRGQLNAPDFARFARDGAGTSQGVYTLFFDDSTEEEVFFQAQLPHAWKEGSNISPHVHWTPTSTLADTTDVVWGLEYTWQSIDGVFADTAIMYTTGAMPSSAVDLEHVLSEFPMMTGAGMTLSSMVMCRLFRAVDDGDTYGDDVAFLEADFHFEVDMPGSTGEYVK